MKKLLPIILAVLYFVDSKYLLVKTDEGHSGEETLSDYRGGDYEANGTDYNIFLRRFSKAKKWISSMVSLMHLI